MPLLRRAACAESVQIVENAIIVDSMEDVMAALTENNQTKSNGRGGARRGSGRKPGAATTRTREIADKAAGDGITPLEVMLKAMRHHMAEFDKSKSLEALSNAALAAKDAAPYIHPRLSSVEMDADVKIRSLAQELAELNESN